MSEDSKKLLDELIKERELIEKSLQQSFRELEAMGVGPKDSLIDAEGYPRVDIDLHRTLSLKQSISSTKKHIIIYLLMLLGQQNDYKHVMAKIEELLPQVFPSQNNLNSFDKLRISQETLEPFAKIGVVPTGSQAYKAVYALSYWCNLFFVGPMHK